MDSTLATLDFDSILPADRRYDELARFYAAAGNVPRAREFARARDINSQSLGRVVPAEVAWTDGVIALASGDLAAAEARLRESVELNPCKICVLPDLARALEAAGKSGAAVTAYERYVRDPWVFRYEPDAIELAAALRRLGELYEAGGEEAKAAAAYTRLLALWRRADLELSPTLREIRSRLGSGGG